MFDQVHHFFSEHTKKLFTMNHPPATYFSYSHPTQLLNDIDANKLPLFSNLPAPSIAKAYWKLSENAMFRDLVLAVRWAGFKTCFVFVFHLSLSILARSTFSLVGTLRAVASLEARARGTSTNQPLLRKPRIFSCAEGPNKSSCIIGHRMGTSER